MRKARASSSEQIALPKVVHDHLGLTDGGWREWDSRFKGSDLLADLAAERRRELEDERNSPGSTSEKFST
jgi:hypothetical protein